MIPLLIAVLTASLLGNLHCAGMCGAFVALALRLHDPRNQSRRFLLLAAYNAGRLLTYVALGAAVGALGSVVDAAGTIAGLGRVAGVFAGAFMVLFAALTLARLAGWRVAPMPLPEALHKLLAAAHRRAAVLPPVAYAVATGLLTTLLPCGWLYAFVTVAGGTASAGAGAIVMAVFWLGTLPVLVTVGLTLQKVGGKFARRLPVVTALAVLVMGLYTLVARMNAGAMSPRRPLQEASLVAQVKAISQSEPPCCVPAREGPP